MYIWKKNDDDDDDKGMHKATFQEVTTSLELSNYEPSLYWI